MCEIVLVVVSGTDPNLYIQCGACYQAGDIIDVLPDGWGWSQLEQSNPNWRILKFPGVPITTFDQYRTGQQPVDQNNPSKTLLRRATSFNYQGLPTVQSVAANAIQAAKIAPYIADATRAVPTLTVSANAVDLQSLAVVKALVQDPVLIGTNQQQAPTTIG